MDNILKQEMDNLKKEVGEKVDKLSNSVEGIETTVNEISFALMGNKFTKDGGIIGKMIQMEANNEIRFKSIEGRVETIEKNTGKKDAQDKILWTIVGAVGSSVLYFVINFFIKLINK